MPDPELERALRRLLHATQDFTVAYEAWTHAPRPFEAERRTQLEIAEERLTLAKHDVALVQRHDE
jgi:hypothetical protein